MKGEAEACGMYFFYGYDQTYKLALGGCSINANLKNRFSLNTVFSQGPDGV